jgi:hypothetical protein
MIKNNQIKLINLLAANPTRIKLTLNFLKGKLHKKIILTNHQIVLINLYKRNNKAQIEIKKSQPTYFAAISFSGYANDEKIAIYQDKLAAMLKEKNIMRKEGFYFLGYNAPFQFVGRTNEVIIPIEWIE